MNFSDLLPGEKMVYNEGFSKVSVFVKNAVDVAKILQGLSHRIMFNLIIKSFPI